MPAVPIFSMARRPTRSTSHVAATVAARFASFIARSPALPSAPPKPALWKIITDQLVTELMPVVLFSVSTATTSKNGTT